MFIARMRDGSTIKESDGARWKDIDVHNITSLQLYTKGKYYTISLDGRKVDFIQLKRALTGTGIVVPKVIERVIGFIYKGLAIKLVINEEFGNVRLSVEEQDERGRWRRV